MFPSLGIPVELIGLVPAEKSPLITGHLTKVTLKQQHWCINSQPPTQQVGWKYDLIGG
jgi:hypothetical protein